MAGCYECIDRCPDLSIKITDNDIKILENCTNCNACLYICPNSVFYVKENKADNNKPALESKEKIFYFCSLTEPYFKTSKTDEDYFIKCIYEVEDLDIISAIKNKAGIFFVSADCKSCRLKYFHNKKIKRINEIAKFLNAEDAFVEINMEDFNFKEFIKERGKEALKFKPAEDKASDKGNIENIDGVQNAETLDRREFFKNSFKSIKNNAKKLVENISIEDLPLSELYSQFIDTGENEKRINYLLLKRQKNIYRFLKENKELVRLLNIRLPKINENCVFCSNCWELCPTDALSFKENQISLEPFFCTGCGLCKDICSFGALRMYKAVNLKDISGEKLLLLNKDNF
jgi:Fe-S-cluster-containing hydrogenase component 2